jgi:signal transduction histidine kinase
MKVRGSAPRPWATGLVVGAAAIAIVSLLIGALKGSVDPHSLLGLYLFAIFPVAIGWGFWAAGIVTVGSLLTFTYFFSPPIHSFRIQEPDTAAALVISLAAAYVVSELARRATERAREARLLADQQAALRRVATLVAQAVPTSEVLEAVTREVGLRCDADLARMESFEPDRSVTAVAAWSRRGEAHLAVGTRFALEGASIATQIRETGRPARVDSFVGASGPIAREAHELGIRSSVGCPIVVGGQTWGVIAASTTSETPFPPDTESRIAEFTELAAAAIANTQSREELRNVADEQAALRRVATLVARAAAPTAVFTAVAEEVGRLLSADVTGLSRFEMDDSFIVVAAWSATDEPVPFGVRVPIDAGGITSLVRDTGRPARIDDYADAAGGASAVAAGIRASVAAPITVEGQLWGAIVVASTGDEPLPPRTEERLGGFAELVATAIAKAESQAELRASRARVVAAADETRRQIERDLHDGAQQRLVTLALQLRAAQEHLPPEVGALHAELEDVAAGLIEVLDEVREMARGIHPAILAKGGLGPALKTLARRSALPVTLDIPANGRLPEAVEVGAYYVVSEALTNATKHARASSVTVEVEVLDVVVRVSVSDDGVGGADFGGGSGLVGLKDRVEALGGRIAVESAPGAGTAIRVELPLSGEPESPGSSVRPP